jgi:hypothetical protein
MLFGNGYSTELTLPGIQNNYTLAPAEREHRARFRPATCGPVPL